MSLVNKTSDTSVSALPSPSVVCRVGGRMLIPVAGTTPLLTTTGYLQPAVTQSVETLRTDNTRTIYRQRQTYSDNTHYTTPLHHIYTIHWTLHITLQCTRDWKPCFENIRNRKHSDTVTTDLKSTREVYLIHQFSTESLLTSRSHLIP